MTSLITTAPSTRARTVLLWTLSVLSAGMLFLTGTLKLAGVPVMVQLFTLIGFGQWFRYLTGSIEVVGAILLFVPSLALFGAVALAATMVGAVLTHLFLIGGSFAVPLVLLAATTTVGWLRWPALSERIVGVRAEGSK